MLFGDALTKIAGALRDPYLLFGLGAGIILVGALTTTGNVALVLIVAAVLVIALAARLVANVQARRGGAAISARVDARHARIVDGRVGVVNVNASGPITVKANVADADVERSEVATVTDQAPTVGEEAPKHVDDRPIGS